MAVSSNVPYLVTNGWICLISILAAQYPFQKRKAVAMIVTPPTACLVGAIVAWYHAHPVLAFVLIILLLMLIVFTLRLSHMVIQNRQPAFPEALQILQDRARKGSVQRTPEFDIYLPAELVRSTTSNRSTLRQQSIDCAFLFIPGALIEPTAYAGIASKLAEEGILVVVQNTEPFRLPSTLADCTEESIRDTMKYVRVELGIRVTEWAIGGHSMGTTAAACLTTRISQIRKLVFWGSCVLKGVDLSDVHDLSVLNGTNDGFFTSKSEEELQDFRAMLPPEHRHDGNNGSMCRRAGGTKYHLIKGGNHAGFAHYGPHTFSRQDGERSISLEEHHREAVQVTAKFLLSSSSKATKRE